MKELFELEWMGGPAEHHFRRARPGVDDLPWGTLDASDFPPAVLEAARVTWTRSCLTEYRAIAAFSEVLRALCEAKAPVDVIGMASSFVADEVVHVELASRMVMELGGGAPIHVDLDRLFARADTRLTAFQRANEMVLRVSCVAEAFSGKMVVKSLHDDCHPLTLAVLKRIVADESLHYRLGGIYFEWASERMDDAERARLAAIALSDLAPYSTRRDRDAKSPRDPTADGRRLATLAQIRSLGWVEARSYANEVRDAVTRGIVAPLATYGIALDAAAVDAMFPEERGADSTAHAAAAATG
jgi:hypothetical protein